MKVDGTMVEGIPFGWDRDNIILCHLVNGKVFLDAIKLGTTLKFKKVLNNVEAFIFIIRDGVIVKTVENYSNIWNYFDYHSVQRFMPYSNQPRPEISPRDWKLAENSIYEEMPDKKVLPSKSEIDALVGRINEAERYIKNLNTTYDQLEEIISNNPDSQEAQEASQKFNKLRSDPEREIRLKQYDTDFKEVQEIKKICQYYRDLPDYINVTNPSISVAVSTKGNDCCIMM
jgi:hypothetical protein